MKKLITIITSMALAAGGLTTVTNTQAFSSGSSDIILLGDVDGDNSITLQDAQKILRFYLHIEVPAPEQKIRADVNDDGRVDLCDAQTILRIALKIEPERKKEIAVTEEPTATPEAELSTTAPTLEPTPEATIKTQLQAETSIPIAYREENTESPGSVITINYQTYDYLGNEHEITKSAYVYLPYGYDETKQYNVVYAMHGVGGTSNEWEIAKNKSLLKKYFDNMIANGDM